MSLWSLACQWFWMEDQGWVFGIIFLLLLLSGWEPGAAWSSWVTGWSGGWQGCRARGSDTLLHVPAPPSVWQAYADYIGFILTLNEGVKGKKLSVEYRVSEVGKGRSLLGRVFPKIAPKSPQWDQCRK